MVNYEKFVDIKKVTKVCKSIGEFIMFKSDIGNLLVTKNFILNLEAIQFWKLQCALEIPERGKWYLQQKDRVEESDRDSNVQGLKENYMNWMNQRTNQLANTQLILQGSLYLYATGTSYTAIKMSYIDMLKTP